MEHTGGPSFGHRWGWGPTGRAAHRRLYRAALKFMLFMIVALSACLPGELQWVKQHTALFEQRGQEWSLVPPLEDISQVVTPLTTHRNTSGHDIVVMLP
jgi:hypothetical protein